MQLMFFDTDAAAPGERLPLFRRGAVHFNVEPLGPADAFFARWRLLKLGDVNAIHSIISPVRYRRDRAMIEADGEDRVAIHVRLRGDAHGWIDGEAIHGTPGGAAVWDLSRPLDVSTDEGSELLILTLPRYMVQEVLPGAVLGTTVPPGPELAMAARQLRYLINFAEKLPETGAAYFGRALRDLFAVALLPSCRSRPLGSASASPLLLRICERIDAHPEATEDVAGLAAALDAPTVDVERALEQAGGLATLVERRRLLAAYRLLLNPADAAPVSTIARRCGFSDMAHFSRRFRDVFHSSARDLRHFHRGDLPGWAGAYHVEQNYGPLRAR